MDGVFREIGVEQQSEMDVLSMMLQEKRDEQEKIEKQQHKRARLTFRTVASSIVEDVSVEESVLDSEMGGSFRRKQSSRSEQIHRSQRLNNLIAKAVERARDLDSPIKTQKRTRGSPQSDAKGSESSVICPHCRRRLRSHTGAIDDELSEHLVQCPALREQSASNSNAKVGDSSGDDSEIESSTNDSAQWRELSDDWEDTSYRSRLSKVPPEELTSTTTDFGTLVYECSWERLYEYQKEGVRWLHDLYCDGLGGILADEMGLGKTAQVCAHLGSLSLQLCSASPSMSSSSHRRALACPVFLVVCPATVLRHWCDEMHRWAPELRTVLLHSVSRTGKMFQSLSKQHMEIILRTVRRSPVLNSSLVIVTTYEGVRKYHEVLESVEWTAVILDEGQKIRNYQTEIAKICGQLPSYHRIILSGTPIQNNLRELWSLFDFVYPGRLGTLQAFEEHFANPIRAGGFANTTKLQLEIALRCASTLQAMVRPYLLRRKKDAVATVAKLPEKQEHILCCQLSPVQRQVYKMILASDEIRRVLENRTPAFRAINTLRKLCNHPSLVYRNGSIVWQIETSELVEEQRRRKEQMHVLNKVAKSVAVKATIPLTPNRRSFAEKNNSGASEVMEDGEVSEVAAGQPPGSSVGVDEDCDSDDNDRELHERLQKDGSGSISWCDSGKMLVLSKILPIWKSEGHKVLIFSQTQGVLDLLQMMLEEMNLSLLRLDGSTPVARRPQLIAQYNNDSSVFAMLLTTKTGGVGISLTAANRVILFDPDWNPMTDIQARERAWRLGQKREVVIYRLVSKGTIEQQIYQRQILKLLISNRVLDKDTNKSIFSKSQLHELFQLNDGMDNIYLDNQEMPEESRIDLESTTREEDSVERTATVGRDEEKSSLLELETVPYKPPLVEPLPKPSESESSTSSKDHYLLKALFDGDAISDVYNHEYIEPGARRSHAQRDSALERRAADIARNAHLSVIKSAKSSPIVVDTNSMGGHLRDTTNAVTSASLLDSIRARKQAVDRSVNESVAPNQSRRPMGIVTPRLRGVTASIETRLKRIFASPEASQGFSTDQILQQFQDVDSRYAAVFKQLLRSIAVIANGKWKKKQ